MRERGSPSQDSPQVSQQLVKNKKIKKVLLTGLKQNMSSINRKLVPDITKLLVGKVFGNRRYISQKLFEEFI